MPVSFTVSEKTPRPVAPYGGGYRHSGDQELLEATWGQNGDEVGELLQSSFGDLASTDFKTAHPSRGNGFVDAAMMAYARHHNLVIRPDDVWIAILTQFNFYVNAHAEDLRYHFVAHQGKKKLVVYFSGTRYTVDFGSLARQMTEEIHKNVVDETLVDWIMPDFTTTTHNDSVVAAITLMATLKEYFTYCFQVECGIPRVTLEGSVEDWENILSRLDKLEQFGLEPARWAQLLRPIIKRFIGAFSGEVDIDFWESIAYDKEVGCGAVNLSGWITAFCVWSDKGEWLARDHPDEMYPSETGRAALVLDGVKYPFVSISSVPVGFCEVPVELKDYDRSFDCLMVAGHIGTSVEGTKKDTIRPLLAWFMFIESSKMPRGYSPPVNPLRQSVGPLVDQDRLKKLQEKVKVSNGKKSGGSTTWKSRLSLIRALVTKKKATQ